MFETVRQLLADQLELDPELITEETDIITDLGADSLDIMELIMTLEDEYGLLLGDENVEGLRTVGQVVEFLEKLS